MSIHEMYQRIMQRHCQIVDVHAELHGLLELQGSEIIAISTMIGDACVDSGGNDLEMAVHVPSTAPPAHLMCESDCVHAAPHEPTAADFAPDKPLSNTERQLGFFEPPISERHPVIPDASETPAVESVPPPSGKRQKTELTAKEWATSMHFLAYMKTEPYSSWTADRQNEVRDKFVASARPDEQRARWGKRFAAFCKAQGFV
jgi:hypothetical protein